MFHNLFPLIIVNPNRTVYDDRVSQNDMILYEDGLDLMLDEDGVVMEYE